MKYILLLSLAIVSLPTLYGMEEKRIPIAKLLNHLTQNTHLYPPPIMVIKGAGDDDNEPNNNDETNAGIDLQTQLNAIVAKAKEAHYLSASKKPITLKYMTNEMLDWLKKEGAPTWNNATTDGKKTIYVNEMSINQISKEQQDALLAHELGHIIINEKPYLNPHALLNYVQTGSLSGSMISLALMGLAPFIKNPKLVDKILVRAGLGTVCGIILSVILRENSVMRDSPNGRTREYPLAQKYQEIVCDVVAGELVGHDKCASLQREKLKHNGNRNGVDGDHPYTTTRIWYHDKLSEAKKLWEKWKNKYDCYWL
jgi:hypothetical protein